MMSILKIINIFFLVSFTLTIGLSQSDYPFLRQGDKLYKEGQYPDAETSYRKAREGNPKPGTAYNLANTMLRQERIPEAIEEYKKAIQASDNPDLKSIAYYNMGNAYFHNKEYEQSINAYKEALKINPTDEDAKKNLMLAMRQLKQQQKENQQDQQQQQEEQQQDQQQQEEQQQEQSKGESPQDKQQPKKEDISKEEANEILKAIEREDQRVQEKLKKTAGKNVPPAKDW